MITDYLTIILFVIVVIVILLLFRYEKIKAIILKEIKKRNIKKEINMAYDKVRATENLKTISFACNSDDNKTKMLACKFFDSDNTVEIKENINTIYDISREINKNDNLDNSIIFMNTNCNEIGKISEISDLLNPQIGIMTDIESKVLDTENTENILKSKYEIIEVLPPEGIAIFNYDDKYIKKLADKTFKEKVLYGIENEELDYYIDNIREDEKNLKFNINNNKEKVEFNTKIENKEYLIDILGAVTVCSVLGINLKKTSKSLEKTIEI
ncbi:MAG: Mur ligase family protein [Senegalia sp. (in: firmicutes)]|uniref:Mur ligase family protein n=1 Tax=Senegalia sp. (in: firmicutes) TaxID=1924098 RepID=UPI003F9BF683